MIEFGINLLIFFVLLIAIKYLERNTWFGVIIVMIMLIITIILMVIKQNI